jgi:hypothetical protein
MNFEGCCQFTFKRSFANNTKLVLLRGGEGVVRVGAEGVQQAVALLG